MQFTSTGTDQGITNSFTLHDNGNARKYIKKNVRLFVVHTIFKFLLKVPKLYDFMITIRRQEEYFRKNICNFRKIKKILKVSTELRKV